MASKKRKTRKIWLILTIAAVILIAGTLAFIRFSGMGQVNNLQNVKTATADIGTIVKTVTGSGNLAADETYEEITVLEGLMIDQVLVEAGDEITAGQTLATFDAVALKTAIRQTQAEIDSLDARLYLVRNEREPAFIKSAVSGRIKQVFAVEGTDVAQTMNQQGALLLLSLDGKLKVSFQPALVEGLTEGDNVEVSLSDGTVLAGKIEKLSALQCVVTVSDKTAAVDEKVVIRLEDETVLGQGALIISRPLAITGTTGKVDGILWDLNDYVYQGTKLLELDQPAHSQAYEDIYTQRLDYAGRLTALLGYASENALKAADPGLIQTVGIAEGMATGMPAASAAAASQSTSAVKTVTAFSVRTASKILFEVAIDELDITVMRVGQPADVTLDALPDKTFAGSISEISDTGTVNPGGTTFKVTVDLPAEPLLRTGMTATAVITVEKKEAIVRIPLEALQELGDEQFVYVGTAASATELGDRRVVTTGISDGEYVEILSGLSDGERVNYYYSTGFDNMFAFGNRTAATHPQELVPITETSD